MRELIVSGHDCGQRLDKYLKKYLKNAPSGFLYKMLRKKNIKLNDKKATGNELLKEEDVIRLYFSEETIETFRGNTAVKQAALPEVIYEDEHILALNKPAGLLTQKASPEDESLTDQVLYYLSLKPGAAENGCRPSVCNRLDRNTTGLVLAGKTMPGLQYLSRALRDRSLEKWYYTLCAGRIEEAFAIQGYLYKDEAANKVTLYDHPVQGSSYTETRFIPLTANEGWTLLKVHLITGKTHQIRAHLSEIGHPIVGDPKYGDAGLNRRFAQRYGVHSQLLHAHHVSFPLEDCPIDSLKGRTITAPLPELFLHVLKEEGLSADYE